jgi:superfamily I DNA and/or RNA helicase
MMHILAFVDIYTTDTKMMLRVNFCGFLSHVHVHVDNFQGEENDIILLSLVRSNPLNRIGYLSEANRICVALSRAKKGLYVIGNFEQLKTKSKLWEKIVDDAIKREFLAFEFAFLLTTSITNQIEV